jgi:hypothetical protein
MYVLSCETVGVLITLQWIQTGLWGAAAAGIFAGYRPPKRHTRLDHLSFWQKLGHLDFPGMALLTTGLTLFLIGLNLGGGLYTWTDVRVLVTLVLGIAIIISFGVYEWKGTKIGILHHDLFRGGAGAGRTFTLSIVLIFVEGIMLFAFVIFYPLMYVCDHTKQQVQSLMINSVEPQLCMKTILFSASCARCRSGCVLFVQQGSGHFSAHDFGLFVSL